MLEPIAEPTQGNTCGEESGSGLLPGLCVPSCLPSVGSLDKSESSLSLPEKDEIQSIQRRAKFGLLSECALL